MYRPVGELPDGSYRVIQAQRSSASRCHHRQRCIFTTEAPPLTDGLSSIAATSEARKSAHYHTRLVPDKRPNERNYII